MYIEKIYSKLPGRDSFIQDLTFSNIKTNAISFGGFEDSDVGGLSTLTIKNINIANCSFDSPDSLIQTKKFTYKGAAQFMI